MKFSFFSLSRNGPNSYKSINMLVIIRWCLIGILISLPFNSTLDIIMSSVGIPHVISYLDEVAVVIFAPLALFRLYKDKRIKDNLCSTLLIQIGLFVVIGLTEGIINGNAPLVTALGTFDYMKNFIIIIIYFAFFTDVDDFKRIFSFIMVVAVVMGAISFIQEAWALSSVHILKKDLTNLDNYIFNNMKSNLAPGYWRFGIYRAPSFMTTSIVSGLYCLLVINIYLWTTKKANFGVVVSLLSGIFTSISRIVFTGFTLVAGFQFLKGRRWIGLLLIPVTGFVIFMATYRDFNVMEMINPNNFLTKEAAETKINHEYLMEGEYETNDPRFLESDEERLREYSRDKAIEIWKDHPIWGVGPGMFGAAVSLKSNSHIYIEYNFIKINYLRFLGNIDNFWFQLYAEMGIVGFPVFIGLVFTIFINLLFLRKGSSSDYLKGICMGLMVFMAVIFIYTLGLGLNIPAILFTHCALTGIGCAYAERA